VHAASIIVLMMEAVSTYETSVCFKRLYGTRSQKAFIHGFTADKNAGMEINEKKMYVYI
jgi:Trk-type K+ transport system membrane component